MTDQSVDAYQRWTHFRAFEKLLHPFAMYVVYKNLRNQQKGEQNKLLRYSRLSSSFPSLLGAYFKESLEAAHWKSSKLRYNWLDLAEEYIAWQRQQRCAEALIYDFTWNSIRILQKTETEKQNFLRLLRCFESFPGEFVEGEVARGGESCKHKYVT